MADYFILLGLRFTILVARFTNRLLTLPKLKFLSNKSHLAFATFFLFIEDASHAFLNYPVDIWAVKWIWLIGFTPEEMSLRPNLVQNNLQQSLLEDQ